MIELKLKNRKGNFHVNSKEVKDILDARQDIGYLQDISNSINQDNIMVFDCELSERVFSKEEILFSIKCAALYTGIILLTLTIRPKIIL